MDAVIYRQLDEIETVSTALRLLRSTFRPPCHCSRQCGSYEQHENEPRHLHGHYEWHIDIGGGRDDRDRVSAAGTGGKIGGQGVGADDEMQQYCQAAA